MPSSGLVRSSWLAFAFAHAFAVACAPAALDAIVREPAEAGVAEAATEPSDAAPPDATVDRSDASRGHVVALAAGGGHVCAVLEGGGVACWGDNNGGESGAAQPRELRRPARVAGLGRPAVALAAGAAHTCAVLDDRTVTCWGRNEVLQRGDTDPAVRPSPGAVVASTATVLAAGDVNTCALVAGTLMCWGANDFGQIGSLAGPEKTGPAAVAGFPAGLTDVGVGFRYVCAATTGSVWCRGRNEQGQLGRGTVSLAETSVVPALAPATRVVRLAVGARHVCALRDDGALACFGANDEGQLGAPSSGSAPVLASLGGARVKNAALGYEHTCAVVEGGSAFCWGGNTFGQVGVDPTTAPDGGVTPVRVVGIDDAVSVVAADFATCVLRAEGRVSCWGENTHGTLGDGTNDARYSPKEVVLP